MVQLLFDLYQLFTFPALTLYCIILPHPVQFHKLTNTNKHLIVCYIMYDVMN